MSYHLIPLCSLSAPWVWPIFLAWGLPTTVIVAAVVAYHAMQPA